MLCLESMHDNYTINNKINMYCSKILRHPSWMALQNNGINQCRVNFKNWCCQRVSGYNQSCLFAFSCRSLCPPTTQAGTCRSLVSESNRRNCYSSWRSTSTREPGPAGDQRLRRQRSTVVGEQHYTGQSLVNVVNCRGQINLVPLSRIWIVGVIFAATRSIVFVCYKICFSLQ